MSRRLPFPARIGRVAAVALAAAVLVYSLAHGAAHLPVPSALGLALLTGETAAAPLLALEAHRRRVIRRRRFSELRRALADAEAAVVVLEEEATRHHARAERLADELAAQGPPSAKGLRTVSGTRDHHDHA
ncbi:hypothetical protein [Streptomyces albus]|uniref:hypothetical protein n=1 Tax=Streptomyces albus TaxID=1888 RepID=UPI0024E06279|nr:hypothetical protein [Streptomyces albus]GHJ24445.1 hypothetical protein TPA0909_60590 [Streptomyces albus]